MESTELEKYLKLADIAYDGKNGAEAYEYASKALEIDMTCAQAWYMKMLAIGQIASFPSDLRATEAITYGKKVMALDPGLTNDVYSFYLKYAIELVHIMTKLMRQNLMFDDVIKQEQTFIELRKAVPADVVCDSQELTALCVDLAKSLVAYEDAIEKAWSQSQKDGYFTEAKRRRYKELIPLLLEGVPEEVIQNTTSLSIKNKNSVASAKQNNKLVQRGCLWFVVIFITAIFVFAKCNS